MPSAILAPICWSPPSGPQAGDLQAQLADEQLARRAGGDEVMLGEHGAVEAGPVGNVDFLIVMGNQRNPAWRLLISGQAHGVRLS